MDLQQLTERINSLATDLDNALRMNVHQRIICKLIKLCQGRPEFALPMQKGVFAEELAIEPETLSRASQRLPDYGVRMRGKEVTFMDRSVMIQRVCDHCIGQQSCGATQDISTL